MATSSAMSTSNQFIKYQVTITQNSQSVANNTSNVTVSVRFYRTNTGYVSYGTGTVYCKIDGTTYSASVTPYDEITSSGIVLFTKTLTISHSADGTKKLTVSAWLDHEVVTSSEQSYTQTLTTIPRASTFTVSDASVDMGTAVTFTITRASTSFTHKLTLTWGNTTSNIATGVATSQSWTPPLTLASDLPNSTSSGCTITCITYNGSTEIGRKSLSMTLTVPASVKPSISSVTISEATGGLASKFGAYIQNKSTLYVSIAAAGSRSSTIKSYSTKILDRSYSGKTFTSDVIDTSGSVSVAVTVTDSRGRTATSTKTVTVTAYSDPTITAFTVQRCDKNGTANDEGQYVKAAFAFNITSLNSKNDKFYTLAYKLKEAEEFTTLKSDSVYSINTTYISTVVFSGDNSYDFIITVADYFTSIPRLADIPTAFTLEDFHSSGTGMAIGKVSEKPSTLEVALDSEFNKNVIRKGNGYAFSSPGVAGSAGYVLMAQLTHKKANADTPITFVFTRRLEASPMVVHVQFQSNSTTVDPGLKGISYEGSNYGAFLVKSTTSVWNLYVQKVSAYDTITLQEWYSSGTVDDRLNITFPGELVETLPTPYYRATPAQLRSLLDYIYPVGSIYLSYSHNDPADLFGGTWVRITNAFLWAVDANGEIGVTGGERNHTLTLSEMPSHDHTIQVALDANGSESANNMIRYNVTPTSYVGSIQTKYTGDGLPHNNMPPYVQISVWRRTA